MLKTIKLESLEEVTGAARRASPEAMKVMQSDEYKRIEQHWLKTKNGVSHAQFLRMGWKEYSMKHMSAEERAGTPAAADGRIDGRMY